ncbi:MAG TPA: hypothetical protein VMM18_00975 [Gemmatimonadaceae bacterium]|nr:hypothetical protein [Gemmatimonadaceae bacterium]
MMESDLQRFLARLRELAASSDHEAALDDSGMDTWEHEGTPLDAGVRAGLFDPETGVHVRAVEYSSAFEAPAGYPHGWPFLAGRDAWFIEVASEGEEMHLVKWPDPFPADPLCDEIRTQLEDAGWHFTSADEPGAADPGLRPRHVGWFVRGGDHRLLSLASDGEEDALVLLAASPDQLWPGWGPTEGPWRS